MGNQQTYVRPYISDKTISHLDTKKYSGVWYEISKFPLIYESDCERAKAIYTAESDTKISVENICIRGGKEYRSRKGEAWVYDKNDPGKLRIVFTDSGPSQGMVSDYWIHDTDYENYSIVGSPSKQFLWILSREETMTSENINALMRRAVEHGYDVNKLVTNTSAIRGF